MKPMRFTSGVRLRALAAATALTCAAFMAPAAAECPTAVEPVADAFVVADEAGLAYLPFTLGEAQDEFASVADLAGSDRPEIEPSETIVLAGSFEFD